MKALAVAALWLTAAMAVVLSPPAAAQQMPTQHVRGQITAADDSSITVKTREGATVRLALASDLSVTSLMKAAFSDVKVGSYVGIAAEPIRPAPRTVLGSGEKAPTHNALDLLGACAGARHLPPVRPAGLPGWRVDLPARAEGRVGNDCVDRRVRRRRLGFPEALPGQVHPHSIGRDGGSVPPAARGAARLAVRPLLAERARNAQVRGGLKCRRAATG